MGAAAPLIHSYTHTTRVHKNGNKIGKVTAAALALAQDEEKEEEASDDSEKGIKPHTVFGKAKKEKKKNKTHAESHCHFSPTKTLSKSHRRAANNNNNTLAGQKLQTRRSFFECVTVHLWQAQMALEMGGESIAGSLAPAHN